MDRPRTSRLRVFRRAAWPALLVLVATLLTPGASAPASETRAEIPEDRYAMAGGCYAVRSVETGGYLVRAGDGFTADAALADAEPFHFQATDLGSYLLYGTAKDYLAASDGAVGEALDPVVASTPAGFAEGLSGGATTAVADAIADGPAGTATGRGAAVVSAPKASELADWEVEHDGARFTLRLPAAGRWLVASGAGTLAFGSAPGAGFTLRLATGCAAFPEVEVNVEGDPARGDTSFGEVRGFVDAHVHMMAYEFIGGRVRCARPWHRFGVEHALVDCPDHEPGGVGAVLEQILSGTFGAHATAGWPTFPYWPKNNSLTHEQIYYKWLERAWRGGLRLMVNLLVDNAALCNVYPYRKNSCNEMDGVRLQAQRIRELERYIDAQSGGPGEGWFRIVTDPFQARRVVNDGKLAVVLGIEVSTPIDCGLAVEVPLCDTTKIDEELDAVFALGVRQMEMANKFDNALTGVTGDAGTTGIVVNSGNAQQTGRYWQMQTCDDPHTEARDKQQPNVHDDGGTPDELSGRDSIFGGVLEVAGTTGAAPVYPPGPHCNVRGLSALGEHFLRGMRDRGLIFDPDHMSALARTQSLDLLEQLGYSGIVSSHSWADDTIYPRVLELGGVVTPHAGSSTSFLGKWAKWKSWADDRYYTGIGFGSDVNGFSVQGGPRGANAANKVEYPFTGFGGVTIDKQRSGQKVYDVNVNGVAHYGLYPDWVEDIRRQAGTSGPAILDDLARGAEAYLQMWERAIGIAPDACRTDVDDLTDADVAGVEEGMTPRQVLEAAGQPKTRTGAQMTFCMTGGRTATVTFSEETVASVAVA